MIINVLNLTKSANFKMPSLKEITRVFPEMHNPDVRASNMFRSQLMNPSMQQSQLQPQTPLQKKCDGGSEANISPKSDMSSVSIVQAEPRVSLRGKNVLENIICITRLSL